MFKQSIDRTVFTDPGWWHWFAAVPLLAGTLAGCRWCLPINVAMCGLMAMYFYARLGRSDAMPVRVRLVWMALLLVGTLPWMHWLTWVQLAGTTAMVSVGYCPLVRILSLASMCRTEAMTRELMWRVFVSVPPTGGLLRCAIPGGEQPGVASCSMRPFRLPADRAAVSLDEEA